MARTFREVDPGFVAGSRVTCHPETKARVEAYVANVARDKTGRKWPVLDPIGCDDVWGPGGKRALRRFLHRAERRYSKEVIREELN